MTLKREGEHHSHSYCHIALTAILITALTAGILCTQIVPVSANYLPSEVWVDDDADPGWYDETHFHTIQEGVDAVADNGTVYVAKGDYEYVDIYHPLTLEGAGIGESFIEDEEVLIEITADEVFVSGFTIRYCAAGIYLDTVEGCMISDCEVYDAAEVGIGLDYAYECVVDGCTVHDIGSSEGIYLYNCEDCSVLDCEVYYVEFGIRAEECSECSVSGCVIHHTMFGILPEWSDGCRIEDCDVSYSEVGIFLPDDVYCMVCGCMIADNEHGIVLLAGSEGNLIVGNTITRNFVLVHSGIHIEDTTGPDNAALFNNIYDNTDELSAGVFSEEVKFYAGYNWWGDPSGPAPIGDGDFVFLPEWVYVEPWLPVPITKGTAEWVVGDGTLDAMKEADTEVVYTGAGSPIPILVAGYAENPGDSFEGDIGNYIDVMTSLDLGTVEELEIRLYYTDDDIVGLDESSLVMYWWNPTAGAWEQCSHTAVDTTDVPPYSGYIWATIRTETTPSLDDLSGAPFGAAGRPRPLPPVGGETLPTDKLALVAILIQSNPGYIALVAVVLAAVAIILKKKH